MKINLTFKVATALLSLATLIYQTATSFAQGTAFTYQGRLDSGGVPANGTYDLRFAIYDSSGGPTVIAGPLTNSPTAVANGLFTVTLDFGAAVFTGAERWLEIGVRTNGGSDFTVLTPRQPITAAPYAMLAGNVSGTVAAANVDMAIARDSEIVSTVLANDGGGSGLDADRLDGFNSEDFWKLGGNAGTTPGAHFLGTTDNRALEFKVNGTRAFRLEPNGGDIPNVIGGASNNVTGANTSGNTIAGGKLNNIATYASFNVIGGGVANNIANFAGSAFIAGGGYNDIGTNAGYGAIGGGRDNNIASYSVFATIAGGESNGIGTNANHSAIGGGAANQIGANSIYGTIGGGHDNAIANDSYYALIMGGQRNDIGTNADYSAIGGGVGNVIASSAAGATIAGGELNNIGTDSSSSTIGGGYNNDIANNSPSTTVACGSHNAIGTGARYSSIGGGSENTIVANAYYATIPGGRDNSATSYAFAAGYRAKADHSGAFVWADSQAADFASTAANQFLIRAAGGVGIGTTAPDAPLHVQSGAVGVSLNSRTVLGLERAGDTWLQLLTTTTNHSGIIFGSPNDSLDASLRYNNLGGRELAFRTLQSTRMVILTNGNVGIGNTGPSDRLAVVNAHCDGSSWINASDRNLKQDFAPVDARAVLEQVVALPVQKWSYQAQPEQRHVGPVAQDFHAAFGLGADEKSIATVDADGVALAAIQGLNQKLESENAALKARVERLERLLQQLAK